MKVNAVQGATDDQTTIAMPLVWSVVAVASGCWVTCDDYWERQRLLTIAGPGRTAHTTTTAAATLATNNSSAASPLSIRFTTLVVSTPVIL
jgi:hypothetical protein